MPRFPAFSLIVALLLPTLGGCAGGTTRADYPSLARRPGERMGFAEPELPAAAPVAADPSLDARLKSVRDELGALTTRFDRQAAVADRAGHAARGRAVGSEAWLSAQSALAELDDARAALSSLASELDQVAAGRAAVPGENYPALEDSRTAVGRELERQTAVIARLAALTPAA